MYKMFTMSDTAGDPLNMIPRFALVLNLTVCRSLLCRYLGALLAASTLLAAPASAQPRIVGGATTVDGTYPWMVAIVESRSSNLFRGQYCAGTLIAPRWVLTAAHCVTATDNPTGPENPYNIDLVINQADLSTSLTGERIGAQQIFIHPQYYGAGHTDLALIYMEAPAAAQPVDLLYPESSLETTGQLATVAGWGRTSDGGFASPKLREVQLPLVNHDSCDRAYPGLFIEERILFCAGFANGGRDACQGDSGGPLFAFDQDLRGYRQAGIVSFGRGCALPDTPGVYTRVSAQARWISEIVRSVEPNAIIGSGNSLLEASFKLKCTQLVCSFNAKNSVSGPTPITSYLWTLSDGRSFTGEKVFVPFDSSGYKKVTLTVSDAFGGFAQQSQFAKPYETLSQRRQTNYAAIALQNTKVFLPSADGEWVNPGKLTGILTVSAGVTSTMVLQRWSPVTRGWKLVDKISSSDRTKKIAKEARPGIYRWKLRMVSGGSQYYLKTKTP